MPPPPARPRSRAVPALLAVALVGAGGYAAWRFLAPHGEAHDDVVEETGPGAVADLTGRQTRTVVDIDPFAVPPLSAEEIREGLAARLVVRKLDVLQRIVARGAADRDALDAVEALARDADPAVALWAKGAAARIAGDRRFVLDLARAAAATPGYADPARILRAIDPVAADALLRACAAEGEATARSTPVPDGLAAAIEALARDPEAGARSVTAAVERTEAGALATWLGVAAGLRPVPAAAVEAALARWTRGTADERTAVARFLLAREADLAAAGPSLAAFVLARLEEVPEGERGRWWAVAARAPALGDALAERLLRDARAGPAAAQQVLGVFGTQGPRAREAGPRLVDLVRALPDDARPAAVQALAAVGGDAIVAYAAERLARGTDAERDAWLLSLAPADDPTPLVEPLRELLRAPDEPAAARAADALVRVSTRAPAPAAAALVAALEDPRAAVRSVVVAGLDAAATWPEAVAQALVRATEDPEPAVRAAAVRVVSGAWRVGAAAAPAVPALVRIATVPDEAVPEARARALRSLATVAPDDPRARAAFVAAAGDGAADVRLAAVAGLARQASPTAAEKAAVAAHARDPALRALVKATLDRPSWQAVR
ncbi:MAG: hypothetical protein U1E39_06870 [Planctomycetota bacterium]